MTTDVAAGLWVNLTDVHESHVVKWEWYYPDMTFYGSFTSIVEAPPAGKYWTWYVVYAWISIEGYPPAVKPGTWSVKFYDGDTMMFLTSFEIIRWTDVIKEISDLQSSLDELQTEHKDLTTKYDGLKSELDSLKTSYDTLKSDYDSLKATHDTLKSGYDTLKTSHDTLKSDYDKLKSDYGSLESKYDASTAELSTSKNLMYIFIITTIAFIATTIYFARRKPKTT